MTRWLTLAGRLLTLKVASLSPILSAKQTSPTPHVYHAIRESMWTGASFFFACKTMTRTSGSHVWSKLSHFVHIRVPNTGHFLIRQHYHRISAGVKCFLCVCLLWCDVSTSAVDKSETLSFILTFVIYWKPAFSRWNPVQSPCATASLS